MQVGNKNPAKSEVQTMDGAINTLVKGLKRDLLKKHGRVNYTKLRKAGFSEMLLSRLQQS